MRWRSVALPFAAILVAAGCSAADAEDPEKTAYVSLGDSLAVGVQPDEDGEPTETSQGYTDVLHRTLYDSDSTLEHVRMGCAGEDTTSMINGGHEGCDYPEGSQLAAAESFLTENRDRVRLVTLDIGGNNFTGCVAVGEEDSGPEIDIDEECVDDGLERIHSEVPEIASRLRAAAGDSVQIVGMTYYNPFLAALLLDGEDGGGEEDSEELAEYANGVLDEMNEALRDTFEEYDIDVADVDAAFESDNFDVPAGSETGMPVNVERVCGLTWMCDTSRGPDIHTNDAGAQVIAEVFEVVVRSS